MKVIVVTEASGVPKEPVDGKPTVVYWNILGMAQTIRLALAAALVDCVDVRIEAGQDPSQDSFKKAWVDAKPSMPLLFPNLPYFLDTNSNGDGTVKLSQSNTILRFVGKKYQLMGDAPEHLTDQVLDQLSDLEGAVTALSYRRGPEALVAWFEEKALVELERFQPLLKDAKFLNGSTKPSIADMKLYVWIYKLKVIQEKLIGDNKVDKIFPDWVMDFMRRIEALPGVSTYVESPEYMKSPLNNPSAMWQG